jgi:Icc-related predicted phosphoesterase
MIIECIADLHGDYPKLKGGDLLIVAGDITASDRKSQYEDFFHWLWDQPHRKKILVAGNHDGFLEQFLEKGSYIAENFTYLKDSGTEFEGFKIWGSPWTPEFCDWHFMLPRGAKLKEKWDLIPDDTDILITHGPAWGILDFTSNRMGSGRQGCKELRTALERVKPKLHVFGHIHEGYGRMLLKHEGPNTECVNCSLMNQLYEPINKPQRVKL